MKLLLLISSIALSNILFTQNIKNLKWLTLKEAVELNKAKPKKILIDMYTDWCGWCKKMDAETFNHPNIAAFIQEYFYPVKFNAETKDTIEFKNKKYTNPNIGLRSTHSLALELMNNRPSYPTIVYLDEELKPISAVPGFMTPADIEPILVFFARNFYKIYPFEQFKKDFEKTYRDTTKFVDKIKWKDFEAGLKSKKKKIIFFHFEGCIDCAIFKKTTLQHDTIAQYIEKHFEIIPFDILSTDTIVFNNVKYFNEKKEHPFHQLAIYLTNGQIQIPTMIFLNEENQLTSAVPGFFTIRYMEMLLHFFNNEVYKTNTWEQFTKKFKSNLP